MAAALVATLVGADLGLRLADDRLSGNLAHIAEIPAIVERVGSSGAPGSTLLLGNSLTDNGLDADILSHDLSLAALGKVTPDGTSFWDWQCLLEHQVVRRDDRRISRVIVGTAWHLMSDETRADPSRLGALFCHGTDILAPANVGISSPGDIGEFITARALRLYALRDTLRNRALSRAIPHYQRFASEQNAAGQAADAPAAGTKPREVAYARLARLARALKARGTELVVLAMPVRQEYELDAGLEALAASGELRLIDYRHLTAIDSTSFVDDMHLGPTGRRVLTAQLARDLATGSDHR